MTPSHRRNRVKIAGRWVLPGTVVVLRSQGVPLYADTLWTTTPPVGVVLMVLRARRGDMEHAQLIQPATGEILTLNRKHLSTMDGEILSLGPPA